MKTLLVIAVISGRLFGCDHAAPSKDAGHDSGPPDAHITDDATVDDAAMNTRTDAATDAALSDAAINDATNNTDASNTALCPQPRQLPFPEICNAFDDDCDGLMDEGACTDPCDEPW